MPIYEYECTNCGLHFERQQRISDDPIQVCPNCAGRVRRVISPVGIIFKGSGFYVTDNRRSSAGTARKEKSSDSGASSNGKVESTESSASTGEHEKPQSKSEQEKSQSKSEQEKSQSKG
jgi:putative FmdB family regulatory protein